MNYTVRTTCQTSRGISRRNTGVRGTEQEARGVFNAHIAYERTQSTLIAVDLLDANGSVLAEWRADVKVSAA